MWNPLAGIAVLGLAISMIGWVNLLTTHRDHSLSADPFEWFFAVTGSLIIFLSGLIVAWARFGPNQLGVMLSAGGVAFTESGVVYTAGNVLTWDAFECLAEVHHPDGGRELVGSLAGALPKETVWHLKSYLVSGELRLGDLDPDQVADVRAAVRSWAGMEITERSP
jgi:hypothetical protein